jgi:hypothetical protein
LSPSCPPVAPLFTPSCSSCSDIARYTRPSQGSKNMPHDSIRAHLPTATPHCAESGSAGQTGSPNREPRTPNPEVRAPGSTNPEEALSPPRAGCLERPQIPKPEVENQKPGSAKSGYRPRNAP